MTATGLPSPPEQDDVYHVYQFTYAHAPERRVHDNVLWRDMHDGPMPIDYNLWIIRNAHRTILVDIGFGAVAAKTRDRPLLCDPVSALARLGIEPDSVEQVIITHLHYDHAGNIDRFPNAQFHVQDAEVDYATGRCMCEPFMRIAFDVEDVTALIRKVYAGRVSFHVGDAAPFPGITLHHLGGHAKGLQSVRVMTERGAVILASDATHFYANMLNRAAYVLTIDAEQTAATYKALLNLAESVEHVIPGHDPKVRAYFPRIEVSGLPLTVLHEAPEPHSRDEFAEFTFPIAPPESEI